MPPVINYSQDEDFYVARVRNVANTITIEDKRGDQFLTFNVEGLSDKLDKNNNLSDLTDVEAARQNLGVMTSSEVDEAYFQDTDWSSMTRGGSASPTGFDIKIRRLGKTVTITGKFENQSAVTGTPIATIPYSSIGESAKTSTRIYFSVNDVGELDRNRGMKLYVKEFVSGDTYLSIVPLSVVDLSGFVFTVTYIGS